MMEEIAGDDTNGESTFEFVSDKLATFDLTTTEADKMPQPESSNETSRPPIAISSSIPPPAALPSSFSNSSASTVPIATTINPTVETSQASGTVFSPLPPSPYVPNIQKFRPIATVLSDVSPTAPPLTPYSTVATQKPYPITSPSAISHFSDPSSSSIPMYSPSGLPPAYHMESSQNPTSPYIFTPSFPQSGQTSVPAQIYEQTSSPYISTPAIQASATIDLPLDYSPQYPLQSELEHSGGAATGGVWGWFKDTVSGSELLTKVAEKAKNSVDSMITTLDPQMKEYIHSGGDIDVLVTSDKEVKVSPIREAFQLVFKRATVTGQSAQANIAPQPVGFTAGLKGAEERIQTLRRNGHIDPQQVVVSLENFIVELTPDKWYDIGCLVLEDLTYNINLQVYTQATPIPIQYIQLAQDETPPDYPLRWSGLAVTLGQIFERYLSGVHHTEWHSAIVGITRKELIYTAAIALANLYKNQLPPRT